MQHHLCKQGWLVVWPTSSLLSCFHHYGEGGFSSDIQQRDLEGDQEKREANISVQINNHRILEDKKNKLGGKEKQALELCAS